MLVIFFLFIFRINSAHRSIGYCGSGRHRAAGYCHYSHQEKVRVVSLVSAYWTVCLLKLSVSFGQIYPLTLALLSRNGVLSFVLSCTKSTIFRGVQEHISTLRVMCGPPLLSVRL